MANLRQGTVTKEFSSRPVVEDISVDIKRVSVTITEDHCNRAKWARFVDPVSMAIKEELLNDSSCCCVLWESDGWMPRYADDEATIKIYTENYELSEFLYETTYEVKLPRRAELAMRKLAGVSKGKFEPVTLAIDVPVMALRE